MVYVFLVLICIFIFIQDWKSREVSIYLFLALFFSGFLISYKYHISLKDSLFDAGANFIFILVHLAILFIYTRIKEGDWVSLINKKLGIGDVFLWLCLVFMFSPLQFALFFLLSIFVSLVLGLFVFEPTGRTTPLAGIQAIMLIFYIIIVKLVFALSLYDDSVILNVIL